MNHFTSNRRLAALAFFCGAATVAGCTSPPSGIFACTTAADCPSGFECRIGAADPTQMLCYEPGGSYDAGTPDSGMPDTGMPDTGVDAGMPDTGVDAGPTCADLSCSSMDTMCRTFSCDDAAPMCVATNTADTTACEDGDLCTWDTACADGECLGFTGACVADVSVIDGVVLPGAHLGGGDTLRVYDCPVGQVPIGLIGGHAIGSTAYPNELSGLQFLCGEIAIVGGAIEITAGDTLPDPTNPAATLGGFAIDAAVTSACPANEVVVGIEGTHGAQTFANQVAVRCAPLTLTGDVSSGYTITHGAGTAAATVGITAPGSTPLAPHDCPDDLVGIGFAVRSGDIIDSIELRCGDPIVRSLSTGPEAPAAASTAFEGVCPAGSYLIGLDANALTGSDAGRLGWLTPVCARFFRFDDTSGSTVIESRGAFGTPGAPFGSASTGPRTYYRCANPGEVVVGMDIGVDAAGALVTVSLSCAPLGPPPGSGDDLEIGSAAPVDPPLSSATATSQSGLETCPAGTIGVGFAGHADTAADGLALICTPARLPLSVHRFLDPVLDAFVQSAVPSNSSAGLNYLLVEASGAGSAGQAEMLVMWDASGITTDNAIQWAELRMTAYSGYAYGGDGNVYASPCLDDTWTETVTWSTAPGGYPPVLGAWFTWYGSPPDPGTVQNYQTVAFSTPQLVHAIDLLGRVDGRLTTRHYASGYTSIYRDRNDAMLEHRPRMEAFYRPLLPTP